MAKTATATATSRKVAAKLTAKPERKQTGEVVPFVPTSDTQQPEIDANTIASQISQSLHDLTASGQLKESATQRMSFAARGLHGQLVFRRISIPTLEAMVTSADARLNFLKTIVPGDDGKPSHSVKHILIGLPPLSKKEAVKKNMVGKAWRDAVQLYRNRENMLRQAIIMMAVTGKLHMPVTDFNRDTGLWTTAFTNLFAAKDRPNFTEDDKSYRIVLDGSSQTAIGTDDAGKRIELPRNASLTQLLAVHGPAPQSRKPQATGTGSGTPGTDTPNATKLNEIPIKDMVAGLSFNRAIAIFSEMIVAQHKANVNLYKLGKMEQGMLQTIARTYDAMLQHAAEQQSGPLPQVGRKAGKAKTD